MHRNIFCSERRMSLGLGCERKWKNMKISAASENEGWRAKKYEPTLGHIDRSKRDSSHWRSFQLWSIVIFHFLVCRTLGKHKSTIPILHVFILSQFRHLVLVGGIGPISFQHCHKQTPEISQLMTRLNVCNGNFPLEEEEQLLQRKYSTLPLSSVESDALFTLTRSTINLSRRRLENIAPLDAHCSARLLAWYDSLFNVHSLITFGRKATQSKSTSVVLVTASVFPSGLFLEANEGSAWRECRAPRHQCSTSSLKAARGVEGGGRGVAGGGGHLLRGGPGASSAHFSLRGWNWLRNSLGLQGAGHRRSELTHFWFKDSSCLNWPTFGYKYSQFANLRGLLALGQWQRSRSLWKCFLQIPFFCHKVCID